MFYIILGIVLTIVYFISLTIPLYYSNKQNMNKFWDEIFKVSLTYLVILGLSVVVYLLVGM